jgi:hypothetical protein
MNGYKKIIRSKSMRLKILKCLGFVPDRIMIPIQYRIKTGRKLNLRNPVRYTEKLQWYKLFYRIPLMTMCSDKYAVRKYVKKRGLDSILNGLYAVYDSPDSIDFDSLPNSFAMKMTVGSGMNYFVTDKSKEDISKLRALVKEWFAADSSSYGREWCYYNIKPRIVFEELLPMDDRNDLPDYKFFCFDGEPFCLYTMIDYTQNHENGRLGFFDTNFKLLPYYRKDFKPIEEQIPKPKNFELMVKYARILSKGFPHVRVDFYNLNGRIVFGELTFYNASGYTAFEPDKFDFILGEKFVLPKKTIN